tara:strand:- start:533 stop:847 length:315 start_codon:yes stop_codon:yes gene_type:complete
MSKEDNWSKISENASDLSKKIKNKTYEENLVEDIKGSFKETIENTSDILNILSETIDTTVKDEEIKKESKEIINKISKEIQENLEDITGRFSSNESSSSSDEEE